MEIMTDRVAGTGVFHPRGYPCRIPHHTASACCFSTGNHAATQNPGENQKGIFSNAIALAAHTYEPPQRTAAASSRQWRSRPDCGGTGEHPARAVRVGNPEQRREGTKARKAVLKRHETVEEFLSHTPGMRRMGACLTFADHARKRSSAFHGDCDGPRCRSGGLPLPRKFVRNPTSACCFSTGNHAITQKPRENIFKRDCLGITVHRG